MQLGMIGLGRMGGNMVERLLEGGHDVVAFDMSAEAVERAEAAGATGASSVAALAEALAPPRAVWIMVPAGDPVDRTITALRPLLEEGDTVIDGGNSLYKETIRRAADLGEHGLHYVDVGTSGGVWGRTEGYSLMVGGASEPVERLRPLFETLAPASDLGWGHVGPSGAGHFVKMVHNGIEYGMMQAMAEGFAIMDAKSELELDLAHIAEIWRHGSVVRSWLLDLTARGLRENPELEGIAPWVSDSGEGRWTVFESIDLDVPAPTITLALQMRLRSRQENSYADRVLAMMRNQFGGHAIREK